MGQPNDRKPLEGRKGEIPGEGEAQAGSLSTVSGVRGEKDLEAHWWSLRLSVAGGRLSGDGEEAVQLTASLTGWGVSKKKISS